MHDSLGDLAATLAAYQLSASIVSKRGQWLVCLTGRDVTATGLAPCIEAAVEQAVARVAGVRPGRLAANSGSTA